MQTHALFLKTHFLPTPSPAKAFHQSFPIPTISYRIPGIEEVELNVVLANFTPILQKDFFFFSKDLKKLPSPSISQSYILTA